jgi:4Fe-4S ferredoxin
MIMAEKLSAFQIYGLLPKTNCGMCPQKTCMAFAVGILSRSAKVDQCPVLSDPKYAEKLNKLKVIEQSMAGASDTGLIIESDKCSGCGNCVIVCPVNVANEPERCGKGLGPIGDRVVLRVVDGVAQLVSTADCRRAGNNPVLCDVCVKNCPTSAIRFV